MGSNVNQLRRDRDKMAFIRANCKEMTVIEMAKFFNVSRKVIDTIKNSLKLTFKPSPRGNLSKVKAPEGKKTIAPPVPKHIPSDAPDGKTKTPRPPAVYSNSPSPWGIADEFHRSLKSH